MTKKAFIVPTVFIKSAMDRRGFLASLIKNTVGGAALGATYKAGLRPLNKNLFHEVGDAAHVNPPTFNVKGISPKPIGETDLKSYEQAKALKSKEIATELSKESPSKVRDAARDKVNLEGFNALSPEAQTIAKKRFAVSEGMSGASTGGALGSLWGLLKNSIKDKL